jgi:DNA primase
MKEKIDQSIDYLKFFVQSLSKKFDIKSPAQKAELIHTISAEIKGWEDPIMVHESLKSLARLTNVPEEVVGIGLPPPTAYYKKAPLQKNMVDPHRVLELDLLRWLLLVGEENPKVVETASCYLRPEHFWTEVCQKIFISYMDAYVKKGPLDLLSILINVDEEEGTNVMDEILNKKINHERAERHIVETVQKLLDRDWMKEKEEIKRGLAMGGKNDEEMLSLIKQLDALNTRRTIVTSHSL